MGGSCRASLRVSLGSCQSRSGDDQLYEDESQDRVAEYGTFAHDVSLRSPVCQYSSLDGALADVF